MDIDKINFARVKYRIRQFHLNIPSLSGGYEVDSSMIENFVIDKMYDSYKFPYVSMNITIPQYVYRELIKDTNNVTVTMIMEYAMIPEVNPVNDKAFKKYLSGTYAVITDTDNSDIMDKQQINYENTEGAKREGMTLNDLLKLNILLFNKQYLQGSSKVVNGILSGASSSDAIVYVLNQAGFGNVLMSPTSGGVPSQCILPPMKSTDLIKYLCDTYHCYKNGGMVFFDLDKAYILDKSPKCTAYASNEFTKTYLVSFAETKSSNSMVSGCYIDGTEKYNLCNVPEGSIEFTKPTQTNEFTQGNSIAIIDSSTGAVTNVSGGKTTVSGLTGVMINNTGTTSASEVSARLNELKNAAVVTLEGCHIEFFNPNKEIIISFEGTKFKDKNGSYRVSSITTTFNKDGTYFLPVSTITILGGK